MDRFLTSNSVAEATATRVAPMMDDFMLNSWVWIEVERSLEERWLENRENDI
jgi:hypothetical protein